MFRTIFSSLTQSYFYIVKVGGLYFSLNMFLPLLGLTLLFGMNMTEGTLNVATVEVMMRVVIVLGASLIILLAVFLLLINKEVRRIHCYKF